MLLNLRKSVLIVFVLAMTSFALQDKASALTLDFEGLADFELVTNQYAAQGVTFSSGSGGVAFPAGTLNPFSFPPASGTTVVTNEIDTDGDDIADSVGPVSIMFASEYFDVSAYFTYADLNFTGDPLVVSAFSPSDLINPIKQLTLFDNTGSSALLSFSGLGPIGSLYAAGGAGGYFTIDDLSFSGAPGGAVIPEPSTWIMLFAGLTLFYVRKRAGFES